MSTFIVSAFWHGFYPFYYVMFFFAAIMNEVAKDLFKARYLFSRVIPEPLQWIVANQVTMVSLNYLGCMFNALTFTNGTKFGSATYYWAFVSSVVILAASRTLGLVKFAQKLEAKQAGKKVEEPSKEKTEKKEEKKEIFESDMTQPKGDI